MSLCPQAISRLFRFGFPESQIGQLKLSRAKMPKLLIFAPCERVIIGQGDNSVSLIILIQKLQLNQIAPKLEENQPMLARVSLFSEWIKTSGDQGKVFEQRFTFGIPGQTPNVEAMMEFTMTERHHRNVGVIDLLPFVAPGDYEFAIWLRQKGSANWPNEPAASYPIELVHGPSIMAHK
jgi:hypothetical protein